MTVTTEPVSRRGFLSTAASGVGLATGVGTAVAQTDDGGGGTTTVDMTDNLVFDPANITIAPGTTVVWKNVGTIGHTVTAYEDKIPEEATYFASGGFDSEQAARQGYSAGKGVVAGGESYKHTFEMTGTYDYFCIPHETVGMKGTVLVKEGGGETPGDGGGGGPTIPGSAKMLGIATTIGMLATLGLTYVFLKFGGAPERPD